MGKPAVVETRLIPLPQGGTLEVEMTQPFIDRLRQHFELFGEQRLEDDQVRMYVYGAFNTAVTKVEQEQAAHGTGQQGDAPRVRTDGASARDVRRARRRKKGA